MEYHVNLSTPNLKIFISKSDFKSNLSLLMWIRKLFVNYPRVKMEYPTNLTAFVLRIFISKSDLKSNVSLHSLSEKTIR